MASAVFVTGVKVAEAYGLALFNCAGLRQPLAPKAHPPLEEAGELKMQKL